MEKHEEQLAAIQEMRNLMDRASRFRSISGLSAMVAGLLAILCVVFVSQLTDVQLTESASFERMLGTKFATQVQLSFLVLLLISICFGIYLAARNAQAAGQAAWDSVAKRLALHLAIPLVTGGVFSMLLAQLGLLGLIPASTLLFYGLALVNASHYTLDAVRLLGLVEIGLGLLATAIVPFGLVFWLTGFGLMHVGFGLYIYLKYERV
jgi:hypothetical protein